MKTFNRCSKLKLQVETIEYCIIIFMCSIEKKWKETKEKYGQQKCQIYSVVKDEILK